MIVESRATHKANSLLGHLALQIKDQPEVVATQSLVYILKSSEDVAKAMVDFVSSAGIETFVPGSITAEKQQGENRSKPDVTICDNKGEVGLFVENKFWAPLTKAQPVEYLKALPQSVRCMLLFVVPDRRVDSMWGELKRRCEREDVALINESRTSNVTYADTGFHILAITSWKRLLAHLQQAVSVGDHDLIGQDIAQLRGLTDQMNADEFLPLRAGEIQDIRIPCRLINYLYLIEGIVYRLVADGVGNIDDLSWNRNLVNRRRRIGRFVRVYERFVVWIGVNLQVWLEYELTPLWLWFDVEDNDDRFEREVRGLFQKDLYSDAGKFYIPIHLMSGVDRDGVIDDAVKQIEDIAGRVKTNFPEGGLRPLK